MVLVLALVCIGAVFIYLRQVHKRLQYSLKNIQKAEKKFQEEEKQIKEEKQRMEKALHEQAIQEKDARKREEEKTRRENMERQKHLQQEAWERERFRLEESQKKKFDRMIEKEQPQSEDAAQQSHVQLGGAAQQSRRGAKGAKNIHEEMLIIETSSVSRERSYKRLASQFREIYELDKAKALEFIKPLLGDPNPQVRTYVAGGVSQLPVTESVSILFQLWEDPDIKVKAESLRGLHNFYKRPDFTRIFPEKTQAQIRQLVEREKRKGEWLL